MERLARIPTEIDYASEFRYRMPLMEADHLAVAITQSGETVDTLAALDEAKRVGATTVAIVNAMGSQAVRVCDGHIDEQMPTVVVAPRDRVYDKMVSQIEQVKARGGIVLAVANIDDPTIDQKADYIMPIPAMNELLAPIIAVIPLPVFAYEMAVRRGSDVDQPRNLAKSVTVE